MSQVMIVVLRVVSTLAVCVVVAGLFKWNTWYHASVLGATLAFCGATAAPFYLVRRRRYKGRAKRTHTVHPANVVVRGLRDAVAGILMWGFGLFIAGRLPFYDAYFDRDLGQLEQHVKTLEEGGEWNGAAKIIADRLTSRMSRGKRIALQTRHVTDATKGANSEADLEKAIALSTAYGIDGSMAREKLLSMRGGRQRIDERLEWSRDVPLSPRKLSHLNQTRDLSKSIGGYRLVEVDKLVKETTSGLARAEPRLMPAGAKVDSRVLVSDSPMKLVDLFVADKNGAPIEGLEEKDFSVSPEVKVYLARRQDRLEKSANVYFAIDSSDSVRGSIESLVRTGISGLLEANPGWTVSIASFGEVVRPLTAWGEPVVQVRKKLSEIQVGGRTSLHEALAVAAVALEQRPEPRVLVVFTDGQNTVPCKIPFETTLARLKQSRAAVHCVALKSKNLDQTLLNQIAIETGGKLVLSNTAAELKEAFAGLPKVVLNRSYSRLAIPSEANSKFQVTIGKGPHALVFSVP